MDLYNNDSGSSISAQYMDKSMTTKETIVYNEIKQAVLHNQFPPGTVLVERKLSEIYNVSRSPIRYALRQLVKEGLLTDEPDKGIVVPVYTLEDILEVYDLLEVLQVYALQVSLKNYDQIADITLENIIKETKKLAHEDTTVERMEWDIRFHNFIIHYVKNKRLDMVFELLVNQKRRFDITSFEDVEHAELTTQQHDDIFHAVKERDLDGAISSLRAHCQYIKQYYINKLVTGRYNL